MKYDGVMSLLGLLPTIEFKLEVIIFQLKCNNDGCNYGSRIELSSMDVYKHNINNFSKLLFPIGNLLIAMFLNEEDIALGGLVGFLK